jgi:hypothetical protein
MDAVNVEELGWALEGEDVLAREIERTAAAMLGRVAEDPSKLISDAVELSEADRAVWRAPSGTRRFGRGSTRRFRQGVWGYVDGNVPNAEAVIDEQGGHMPDPNLVTERFSWLVQPV